MLYHDQRTDDFFFWIGFIFFCSQGRGVMLQKACIPPLGLVWYMGQAMNSSTLPLERERTGTTSMTSGNLTLGASQLFCLINYANISFINRLNFYYLSCFVLCLWILCFDMFVIFRSEEWKELGRTNRYHLIYKHGLHLKKKCIYFGFFLFKIRIMFLTADYNRKTPSFPSLGLGPREEYIPGVPSSSSTREPRIQVTLIRSCLIWTQRNGVLVKLTWDSFEIVKIDEIK